MTRLTVEEVFCTRSSQQASLSSLRMNSVSGSSEVTGSPSAVALDPALMERSHLQDSSFEDWKSQTRIMFLLISPETDLYQSLPLLSEVARTRFVVLDISQLNQQPAGQFLHR